VLQATSARAAPASDLLTLLRACDDDDDDDAANDDADDDNADDDDADTDNTDADTDAASAGDSDGAADGTSEAVSLASRHGVRVHCIDDGDVAANVLLALEDMRVDMRDATTTVSSNDVNVSPPALKSVSEAPLLLVCGSFFVMRAARAALRISQPLDAFDLHERATLKPTAYETPPLIN
jgi:hypothetical protein